MIRKIGKYARNVKLRKDMMYETISNYKNTDEFFN
jgi:hypothetical protein